MDECKPLVVGRIKQLFALVCYILVCVAAVVQAVTVPFGRGLHSSTYQLNLSRFCQ